MEINCIGVLLNLKQVTSVIGLCAPARMRFLVKRSLREGFLENTVLEYVLTYTY